MKRLVAFSAIFLLGSLAALAEPSPPQASHSQASQRFSNPILGDVVQMSKAGLSDATIVAFLRARRARLGSDVGAEDLIALQKAGVSEKVVSYIAGVARIEDVPDRRQAPPVAYDSWRDRDNRSTSVQPAEPADPSYGEDEAYSDGDAYPGVYDGDPYWYGYPYWYAYSPYFYGGGPFFRGRIFSNHPIGHGGGRFSGHGGGHPSGGHGGHSSTGGHSSGGHSGGSGGHGHH